MFVDFNRVFKEKPQTKMAVPSSIMGFISKSLPEGIKYTSDDDGTCTIGSDGESFTISGFDLNLSEKQKEILGSNPSFSDVMRYLYNSQKPISLQEKKEGYITLNGRDFPIEKISYKPLNPVRYVSGSLSLFPYPFPNPFPLTIGCEKYERKLYVSRVPNNSINIASFESKKDEPLRINYQFDEDSKTFTFNATLELKNAKTIKDIVESIFIYNAFFDGNFLFAGKPLSFDTKSKKANTYNEKNALFWDKVLKLENYFGVVFLPPKEEINNQTACLVEQLYQNLIMHNPTRESQNVNSINGIYDPNTNDSFLVELINKPIYFEFEVTEQILLFGVEIELNKLMGLFNAIITHYEVNEKEYTVFIDDEDSIKKRYVVSMFFKTEQELKVFQASDHNKRISQFREAIEPFEYLKKK
ncbi:MAG: hypothetical protein LBS21_00145 [Clostridiales bacterium]|jgi:hypothetical protein|nr:hypothetical protein [Clostridiales bacterium]